MPGFIAKILNKWQLILVAIIFFLAGVFFEYRHYQITGGESSLGQIRQSTLSEKSAYRFIDPLLACDLTTKKANTEFLPLKTKIENIIANKIYAHQATNVSVYFDTRDGRWLGINPNATYFPASLMKVPTLIAFLKLAEEQPEILSKKIVYDGSYDLNTLEYYKPRTTLTPRRAYTVDDLLERMIVNSDNNALPLLVNAVDSKVLDDVYSDLGISIPPDVQDSLKDYMTVKSYVNFFRVLYNSSYLTRAMSEKALALLSKPDFPRGIEGGVPNTVTVAQKFGERNFGTDPNDTTTGKELHDCGIVYYPGHPYLLCVMTKGTDFDKLAGTIQDISKTIYQYMDDKNKS
ncbi:MAG: serine hydrolase [Candidatus Magasanikbacteria bacterium]|nr:serine hydrolase [Candidatus Magasanikbacteria bacterium]